MSTFPSLVARSQYTIPLEVFPLPSPKSNQIQQAETLSDRRAHRKQEGELRVFTNKDPGSLACMTRSELHGDCNETQNVGGSLQETPGGCSL